MKLPYFEVSAFTQRPFAGNPAGVCVLEEWLPDVLLQSIAAQNNLAETAFLVARAGVYELRWFTPTNKVDLCGHATLASAHVLFRHRGTKEGTLRFHSPRTGELSVARDGDRLGLEEWSVAERIGSSAQRSARSRGSCIRRVITSRSIEARRKSWR